MSNMESIHILPESITLRVEEWFYQLEAEICPETADCDCLLWSSSNPSVVSVNEETGYLYGVSPGQARITATAQDGSGVTGCCCVTVNQRISVSGITLTSAASSMQVGQESVVKAIVCPENANERGVTWSNSRPDLLEMTENLQSTSPMVRVRGKAVGTARITATAKDGSGVFGVCDLSVTDRILVETVTVTPSHLTMIEGRSQYLWADIAPFNAYDSCVCWHSSDESVVTVTPENGYVMAQGEGTATVYATACDGGGAVGCCQITVNPKIPVSSVTVNHPRLSLDVGDTATLCSAFCPEDTTEPFVVYISSDESVATVQYDTGVVTATGPGIATIKALHSQTVFATCEVWVHGKTPVFLIHGRDESSYGTWGATNNVKRGGPDPTDNDEYDPELYGECNRTNQANDNQANPKYIDYDSQEIIEIFIGKANSEYTEHPEGGNLAYHLKTNQYQENVNLFVFNYPNQDAVVHSALKFEAYIENLITYVKTSGSNAMKTGFFRSRADYEADRYVFNIVAHSMGGLVSRYFIETLGQSDHVEKLITICTPHWGSDWADRSNATSILHMLCDHDLTPDSAMFGGSNSDSLDCDALFSLNECFSGEYTLTDELLYNRERGTKYYAIAGIDFNADALSENNIPIDLNSNLTKVSELNSILQSETDQKLYRYESFDSEIAYKIDMTVQTVDDNIVGFLSQIGWTDIESDTPKKRISMHKIFVNIDTNGGNSLFDNFHGKMPHRQCVMDKVLAYLEE